MIKQLWHNLTKPRKVTIREFLEEMAKDHNMSNDQNDIMTQISELSQSMADDAVTATHKLEVTGIDGSIGSIVTHVEAVEPTINITMAADTLAPIIAAVNVSNPHVMKNADLTEELLGLLNELGPRLLRSEEKPPVLCVDWNNDTLFEKALRLSNMTELEVHFFSQRASLVKIQPHPEFSNNYGFVGGPPKGVPTETSNE